MDNSPINETGLAMEPFFHTNDMLHLLEYNYYRGERYW